MWVCDDGHSRNASSPAAHCLLGNEGIAPFELLEKARRELSAYENIEFHKDQVHSITRAERGFTAICVSIIERTSLFFTTGCVQRSDLWETLGCKRDEKGGIITDPLTEESSVPGVYVAGDASRDVLLIAVAIAEGAKAAVAINRALLREDGLA